MRTRNYTELSSLKTFSERFDYLRLKGVVGSQTFGHERWVNQRFYKSREWKLIRDEVIARDMGCDLGIEGREIMKMIHVHHMNPMTREVIIDSDAAILDPEYLVSVSQSTHNAIHYGAEEPRPPSFEERTPFDTSPWKRRTS